jgi:phosphoglycerol transferase
MEKTMSERFNFLCGWFKNRDNLSVLCSMFGFMFLYYIWLSFRSSGLETLCASDELMYLTESSRQPISQASRPFYLFYRLFRTVTQAAGDGYLEAARHLNALLLAVCLPVLYVVGRKFLSCKSAFFFAAVSVLWPSNVYVNVFMVEITYFFCFSLFLLLFTATGVTLSYKTALILGGFLGTIYFVKTHSLMLMAGLFIYFFAEIYKYHRNTQKNYIRKYLYLCLAAVLSFLCVKSFFSYMVTGHIFSGFLGNNYGGHFNNGISGVIHNPFLSIKAFLWSCIGLLTAIILPAGVPLAALCGEAAAISNNQDRKYNEIIIFCLSLVAAIFISCASFMTLNLFFEYDGDFTKLTRVAMRYFDVCIPAILLPGLIIVHNNCKNASPGNTEVRRRLIAALILAIAVFGIFRGRHLFHHWYIDTPEFSAFFSDRRFFVLFSMLCPASILIFILKKQLGLTMYYAVFLPLFLFGGNYAVTQDMRHRKTPNAIERASYTARYFLGRDIDRTFLVASDASARAWASWILQGKADTKTVRPGTDISAFTENKKYKYIMTITDNPADADYVTPPHLELALRQDSMRVYRVMPDFWHSGPDNFFMDLRDAYPENAEFLAGFSHPEPEFRWSDGDRVIIGLVRPVGGKGTLFLRAAAFGPNAGKNFTLHMGGRSFGFLLGTTAETIAIPYTLESPAKRIVIDVPQPARPKDVGAGNDPRRLGLSLSYLAVVEADRPADRSPPPSVPDSLLMDFGKPTPAGVASISGFHSVEPGFRWTSGKQASVHLLSPLSGKGILIIQATAFGDNADKDFELRLNDMDYAAFRIGSTLTTVEIPYDLHVPVDSITFEIPDPVSPYAIDGGNHDFRTLGMALQQLIIIPEQK